MDDLATHEDAKNCHFLGEIHAKKLLEFLHFFLKT
jgi:hypothetical protein